MEQSRMKNQAEMEKYSMMLNIAMQHWSIQNSTVNEAFSIRIARLNLRIYKQMAQTTMVPVNRVWDSVQLYSVRCEECSKRRLIQSKEKYEEIRETFNETSFTCAIAREWRPQVSCEDPNDIEEQDESYCWAMDKPNIPKTPLDWQRILRLRTSEGARFADVYYVAPSKKRIRSMVELDKFFDKHPEFLEGGINTSHFSFEAPVPLDENYVAKRQSRAPATSCLRNTSNIPSEAMVAVVREEEIRFGLGEGMIVVSLCRVRVENWTGFWLSNWAEFGLEWVGASGLVERAES
ncbi:hypothetical protein RD792_003726, partial [Penstemon davidsonii]